MTEFYSSFTVSLSLASQDNIQAPSEAELSSLAHEVETSATEKQAIEKEVLAPCEVKVTR